MSNVTSFTVFHKNPEARKTLGRGFVVGKLEQRTTYQYQGVLPNGKTPALLSEEKIVIKYEVLWEEARHVSPSLHVATDLEWEMLTEEYVLAQDDEETTDDEEEETEEGEELLASEVGNIDTENNQEIEFEHEEGNPFITKNINNETEANF